MRFQRSIRRLHSENNGLPVVLCWGRSQTNPADLVSKVHPDIHEVLNSSFYRHGSPLYLENDFPQNFDVYAYMSGQKWIWVGFPNQDQHVATCGFCQTVCTQTVSEVAPRVLATAQLNFQGQGQHSTLPVEHIPDSSAGHRFSMENVPSVNGTSFTSKTIATPSKPKENTGMR